MVIEPMDSSDASDVVQVYLGAAQKAYGSLVASHLLPRDEHKEELVQFYTSFAGPESPILVARIAGKVSGFCRTKDRPRKVGEITQLYVDPGSQGSGIGKALIGHLDALDKYRKLRLLVIKGNNPAIEFYKKIGFAPTGVQKFLPQFQVDELEFERDVVTK